MNREDFQGLKASGLKIVCLFLGLLLTGCVTTSEPRFGDKADEQKAREQYTELGLRYIQQGRTVEAARHLKRALEIDPKSPEVHNALAIMFQAEKQVALAEEHFDKAIKYGPERTRIRNNYAAFLFSQQRYADACKQLEVAANDSLYEQRSAVYENLGVCYLKLNQKHAALAAFDRAVYINDAQARALLEAALIYFDNGNVDTSSRYHTLYQKLVRFRMAPNTPRSLELGIELARLNEDKNKEASYLLMLKNMFPDSNEYRRIK